MRAYCILTAVILLAACSTSQPSSSVGDTSANERVDANYDCEGERIIAVFGPETVTLQLGRERVLLERLPAASGGRYGADGILFWIHGAQAILERGDTRSQCHHIEQAGG